MAANYLRRLDKLETAVGPAREGVLYSWVMPESVGEAGCRGETITRHQGEGENDFRRRVAKTFRPPPGENWWVDFR